MVGEKEESSDMITTSGKCALRSKEDILEDIVFEELIGIICDEESGWFFAFAKLKTGEYVKAQLDCNSPTNLTIREWRLSEDVEIVAASIGCGNDWKWIHKDISLVDNHQYMRLSISRAFMDVRTILEPTVYTMAGMD